MLSEDLLQIELLSPRLPPSLEDLLAEQLVRGLLEGSQQTAAEFPEYQDDPAGFGRRVLGEEYTEDAIAVMESARDSIVTLAKSGNALGKCMAYGETLVLADGTPVKVEDLIGKCFEVWSVDSSLNRRVSTAYAAYNGTKPVVRIKT